MNSELLHEVANHIEAEERYDQRSWVSGELTTHIQVAGEPNVEGRNMTMQDVIECGVGTCCLGGWTCVLGADKNARLVLLNGWDVMVETPTGEREYIPFLAEQLLEISNSFASWLFSPSTFARESAWEVASVLRKIADADGEDEAMDILSPYIDPDDC